MIQIAVSYFYRFCFFFDAKHLSRQNILNKKTDINVNIFEK